MSEYLPILTMLVLALVFAAGSFLASALLAPRKPTAAKSAPYECGIVPDKEPAERFPVRFYLVAMIFIIFDIEIIFLYPWAVIFRQLELFGLIEMVVFALAVFVSFIYLISNGALDWGPARRTLATTSLTPGRTTDSTVRRISRTGETIEAA
ncbi:MAG: NADH-quinone oxidoreductase subunit A [Actinomycetota bacterium]|nr:NADH-quinone oxidoreductase subunit A [Actinomycetota bacterium]PLS75157.1 MAG: NADH-ubiquinone/plastoquinone oxidoreductase chain 3 [Actinomycetota bacterium]